jgi:predicted transcriptional regulator
MLTEQQRVNQFIESYNRIQRFFVQNLDIDNYESFFSLMRAYEQKHPGWKARKKLGPLAEIRNAVVHNKTAPNRYVCIPSQEALDEILGIETQLINPSRAIPTFSKEVVSFQKSDQLSKVLQIDKDFSQFPIYCKSEFVGLLTENGMTRYLANYIVEEETIIDFQDQFVGNVLESEEVSGSNYEFVSRNETVDQIIYSFSIKTLLEAIFITEHGCKHESLLGVVTRWDILENVNRY